jgi:hypothetical protein
MITHEKLKVVVGAGQFDNNPDCFKLKKQS